MWNTVSRRVFAVWPAWIALGAPLNLNAADFKHEIIYQIITDRFFDGDVGNNNPAQSSGLFDASKTNFQAYWGGDLAGIQQKLPYLAGMGVTPPAEQDLDETV